MLGASNVTIQPTTAAAAMTSGTSSLAFQRSEPFEEVAPICHEGAYCDSQRRAPALLNRWTIRADRISHQEQSGLECSFLTCVAMVYFFRELVQQCFGLHCAAGHDTGNLSQRQVRSRRVRIRRPVATWSRP